MTLDLRGMTPLIQVFDMPASLAFYCDILGFTVHNSSGPVPNCGWVWLKGHGTDLMLNTAYDDDARPPIPDSARVAAHDDTCLYFGCPDVDAAYESLVSKGIDVKPPKVAWYGMKQLYLKDPDGFAICFQWAVKEG
jgi:catechol 2,3-dioxygenase-like lactoylglutathione lyase family enzyme